MSALLLALFSAAAASLAAAAASQPIAVTGDCPSAGAVTAALGSALGADARRAGPDIPRVSDLGDRFSVSAFGQVQQYADPARDCEERARAAAVFIALALNPPVLPQGPPPAPAATVEAPPLPAIPPESARWLDLAAAARLDGAPSSEAGPAIGFELRAAAGRRWLGLAATAGILAPIESRVSSITVRQQRFPLSVSVTARRGLSPRLTLAGAVGAALVPFTLRGEALASGQPATRLDAGLRLAVELRVRATPQLLPFLELHAELYPRGYQLEVAPLGNIGSTGRFWLGVSVGLAFEVTPAAQR